MAGRNRAQKTTKKAWHKAFIKALANTGSVTDACRAGKVMRSTAYEQRHNDPVFAQKWDDAIEAFADSLEEEAVRRARDGVIDSVFYRGKKVATRREFSDTLLIQLLKANRPGKYRDILQVQSEPTYVTEIEVVIPAGGQQDDPVPSLRPGGSMEELSPIRNGSSGHSGGQNGFRPPLADA